MRRKPNPRARRAAVVVGPHFARGAHLWQPVAGIPSHPDTHGVIYRTFDDREPADFVQLEVQGDGRTLHLVSTETGPITPPRRKGGPTTKGRSTRIRLEFGRRLIFDHIAIPRDGGTIQAVANGVEVIPERAVLETIYRKGGAGAGKEKVLNRITLRNERPCSNIHTTLERYDDLFAVDTNTYIHREGFVWITAICKGEIRRLNSEGALLQWRHLRTVFSQAGSSESGEIHGWLVAIALVEAGGDAKGSGSRALVVDAHLSDLEEFSERSKPLRGTTFLPERWKLVYATSDAGTQEFLPNVMLAGAHRNAKLAVRRLRTKSFAQLWPVV